MMIKLVAESEGPSTLFCLATAHTTTDKVTVFSRMKLRSCVDVDVNVPKSPYGLRGRKPALKKKKTEAG